MVSDHHYITIPALARAMLLGLVRGYAVLLKFILSCWSAYGCAASFKVTPVCPAFMRWLPWTVSLVLLL